MKKALGVVCGLTILSACSLFESEKKTMASDTRFSPMLNNGGYANMTAPMNAPMAPMNAPMAATDPNAPIAPAFSQRPSMNAMDPMDSAMDRGMPPMGGSGGLPMPPEPPAFINGKPVGDFMAMPAQKPAGGSDAVMPVPPAPVMSAPLTPPPLPGTANAPVLVASASDNTRLAPVSSAMPMPPAPPVIPAPPEFAPKAAAPSEQRRMPEFNRTVLNGEAPAQVAAATLPQPPVGAMKLPEPPAPPAMPKLDDSKLNEYPKLAQVPPALVATPSIDADPRVQAMRADLARMEASAPVPPAPPAIAPKIVSKSEPAPMPVPPAPVQVAALPPAPPANLAVPPAPPIPQGMTSVDNLRPIPPMPAAPASTSLGDLRPLPPSPIGNAPASVITSSADPYTNADNLVPLSGHGQYRSLPDSRYAKLRAAARNSTTVTVR